MVKVAIQGHATRGLEVIGILEALGGKNCKCLDGTETSGFYYIDDSGVIRNSRGARGVLSITCFKLEEFLEKYPYKIGDRVCYIPLGYNYTVVGMWWIQEQNEVYYDISAGEYLEIEAVTANDLCYPKPESMEEAMEDEPNLLQQLKDYFDNTPKDVIEKEWHEYDKYNEIGPSVEEYLEYVNNIRNPRFPKTYEECCEVLLLKPERATYSVGGLEYKRHLIVNLQRLLICRDAYWKLTDDWKPDWEDGTPKYGLIVSGNRVKKQKSEYVQMKFCFPTEDILNAFCENFDKPINNCKEML